MGSLYLFIYLRYGIVACRNLVPKSCAEGPCLPHVTWQFITLSPQPLLVRGLWYITCTPLQLRFSNSEVIYLDIRGSCSVSQVHRIIADFRDCRRLTVICHLPSILPSNGHLPPHLPQVAFARLHQTLFRHRPSCPMMWQPVSPEPFARLQDDGIKSPF